MGFAIYFFSMSPEPEDCGLLGLHGPWITPGLSPGLGTQTQALGVYIQLFPAPLPEPTDPSVSKGVPSVASQRLPILVPSSKVPSVLDYWRAVWLAGQASCLVTGLALTTDLESYFLILASTKTTPARICSLEEWV